MRKLWLHLFLASFSHSGGKINWDTLKTFFLRFSHLRCVGAKNVTFAECGKICFLNSLLPDFGNFEFDTLNFDFENKIAGFGFG